MKVHVGVLKWLLSAVITALLLTGCLESGSSTPATTSITGTAATGAAIAGSIDLVDANGVTRTATIGANGAFSIDTTGLAAPIILRATGNGANAGLILFSLADGVTGVFNVTPLTNLTLEAMRQNIGAGAPADLPAFFAAWNARFNPADLTNLQTELRDAMARVNANLQAQFQANGLDAATFDFLRAAFTPNGAGIDGVLDNIRVVFGEGGVVINNPAGGLLGNFNFQINIAGFNIGGGAAGGGGGGAAGGNCDAGATATTYSGAAAAPYANGGSVCFAATPTSLAFSGKTLANPTGVSVIGDYTILTFTDADTGYKYETVLVTATSALHEINLLSNASAFLGQFAPAAAGGGGGGLGGTYTLILGVSISNAPGANIVINNVPKPADQAEFCGAITGNGDTSLNTVFANALQGVTGSFTVNSCTFNGTIGTVTATLALTSPVAINVPYAVTYTYN